MMKVLFSILTLTTVIFFTIRSGVSHAEAETNSSDSSLSDTTGENNSAVITPEIKLGVATYAGTGCPIGSAAITLSPDGKSLQMIFDQYQVIAGREFSSAGTNINFARKSCNISIPVNVPVGYSVSMPQIAFHGHVNVPMAAMAALDVTYFFAGSRGPTIHNSWIGPVNKGYSLDDQISANVLGWSPCGQSVTFRLNTVLTAKTNGDLDPTMANVEGALNGTIQWRKCN